MWLESQSHFNEYLGNTSWHHKKLRKDLTLMWIYLHFGFEEMINYEPYNFPMGIPIEILSGIPNRNLQEFHSICSGRLSQANFCSTPWPKKWQSSHFARKLIFFYLKVVPSIKKNQRFSRISVSFVQKMKMTGLSQ